MSKKIHLLIFSPSYPPRIGGLESHADEFNKYITKKNKNISITVFAPRLPSGAPEKEILHDNAVTIIRFPAFFIIPNYPLPKLWDGDFWKKVHAIHKNDYDIIISRIRFFITSFLALIYARWTNVPLLHIEHCSDFVQMSSSFKNIIARIYDYTLGKAVLAFSSKNVANSKKGSVFCSKLYKNSHCTVIPRGVEIDMILDTPPAILQKDKYREMTIITFVGRLIDGKGVADLLTAVKDVERNFIVFIVGDGSQMENLKKLVKKYNLQEKVIFHGMKTQKESIGIMKASHVIVSPSYTEGIPTSLIEAALCKKAIIATNVGGTNEVISGRNDGILINPRDVQMLKNNIIHLIDNPDLQQSYGITAFNNVKDKFSWDRASTTYVKIFHDILK